MKRARPVLTMEQRRQRKKAMTGTERSRRSRERKREREAAEGTTKQERQLIESFRYTVRNELRDAIRHGCLQPLKFWVDGEGELRDLRALLWEDGDYERMFNERQRAAEAARKWPELDDVPEIKEADAVAATAAKLGIELVNP